MRRLLLSVSIVNLFLSTCCFAFGFTRVSNHSQELSPPVFDSNPQLDMVLTNRRPILSIGNPSSCPKKFTIEYEISKDPAFPQNKTIHYDSIRPENKKITEFQVKKGDDLSDGTYYWRARCVSSKGNHSKWVETRFHVNVKDSRTFSGYLRAPVKNIEVSGGQNPRNIIEWNDQGQDSFWNSVLTAGETFSWVMLDMGKPIPVSRFWMLSTRKPTMASGWLTHFAWQSSNDAKSWKDIPGTEIKHNNTFRNTIDFKPVNARYYRLVIYSQNALQAQIDEIIPYVKGQPKVPKVPSGKYVLIIGNQMNGYTYTQLAKFVEARGYKTVVIPHYEFSCQIFRKLKNKPMAIILSGNNASWPNLPLFEYYGEFELVRTNDDIPMMGICAGNEFIPMSYGISFVHWMGWFDSTLFRLAKGEKPEKVRIKKDFQNDQIFEGLPNPFQTIEIHSWAISPLFLKDKRYREFRETSSTSYIQMLKSTKRSVYSEQFHAEVVNKYNQSAKYLENFLMIANDKYNKKD